MSQPELATSRVFNLVLNQLLSECADSSRREHQRVPWRVSLQIQPLDHDFSADGPPFYAISSDVSRSGMGFIYPDPMQHDFARITISDSNVSVIAKLIHSTSIGTDSPLYLVGAEFLMG